MEKIEIIYASWYLSDRWGSREEIGCSLHKSLYDFDLYVSKYHDTFTNERTVCIYNVPRKPKSGKVSGALYEKITNTEFGLNISFEEEQELIKNNELII